MIQSEKVPEKVPESFGVVTKTLKKTAVEEGLKTTPRKNSHF